MYNLVETVQSQYSNDFHYQKVNKSILNIAPYLMFILKKSSTVYIQSRKNYRVLN